MTYNIFKIAQSLLNTLKPTPQEVQAEQGNYPVLTSPQKTDKDLQVIYTSVNVANDLLTIKNENAHSRSLLSQDLSLGDIKSLIANPQKVEEKIQQLAQFSGSIPASHNPLGLSSNQHGIFNTQELINKTGITTPLPETVLGGEYIHKESVKTKELLGNKLYSIILYQTLTSVKNNLTNNQDVDSNKFMPLYELGEFLTSNNLLPAKEKSQVQANQIKLNSLINNN